MFVDNRKHLRFEVTEKVKVTDGDGNKIILDSQNISDNGAFLYCDNSTLPNIGGIVVVQLTRKVDGQFAREINAVIVRQDEEGIGVEFLFDTEL